MGSQEHVSSQVERVPHVARGVVGRNVELGEVILIPLHFPSLHHIVAHAQEDIDALPQRCQKRMSVTRSIWSTGKGHIKFLRLQPSFDFRGSYDLSLGGQSSLNRCLCLVGDLSHDRSVGSRQLTHGAEGLSQLTLATEEADSQRFDFIPGRRRQDRPFSLSLNRSNLIRQCSY